MSASTAQKSFDLTNSILEISPQDEIYRFDVEENKRIDREAPWAKESVSLEISDIVLTFGYSPHYFKSCKISAVALIKMVHDFPVRRIIP